MQKIIISERGMKYIKLYEGNNLDIQEKYSLALYNFALEFFDGSSDDQINFRVATGMKNFRVLHSYMD